MFNGDEISNITFHYPALDSFSTWYRSVHGYASLVVCLLGMTLNFFNIIVLSRRHMLSSTNAILTALAISDFITMIVYIPSSLKFYCILESSSAAVNGTTNCNDADVSRHDFFWTAYALFYINVTVTMHSISIWLTVLLAIFRYLYVCHNKIGKKLCTRKNTIIAITCTYAFCIVLCIPTYIISKISAFHEFSNESLSNSTTVPPVTKQLYEIGQSEIDRRTDGLIFRITFFSQAFCIKLIPCILLIIFSCLLIHSIQVANKNNKRLRSLGRRTRESEKAREHTRTNIMLVLVCVLFFATEFPQGVLAIMSIIFEKSHFHSNVYMKLGDVMDILALINNAINFVLYCLMSHIFRQTFRNIFCKPLCLKYKKFNNSIKSYRTSSSFNNNNASQHNGVSGGSVYLKSRYSRNQSDALFNNDDYAAVNFNEQGGGEENTKVIGVDAKNENVRLIERNTRLNSIKFNNSRKKRNRFMEFISAKFGGGSKCEGSTNAAAAAAAAFNKVAIVRSGSSKRTSDGSTPKAVRFSIS